MKYANKWLHKSHVKIYEMCPLKFDATYNDIIKRDKPSYSMAINEGLLVHDWLELLHKYRDITIDDIIHHIDNANVVRMVTWLKESYLDLYPPAKTDLIECTMESASMLRGTIDRYADYGDTKILFELKTGYHDTIKKTYTDFAFYTILLRECGYDVTHWVLINPRMCSIKTVVVNESAVKNMRKTIYNIRTTTTFSSSPGVWCSDCPMLFRCQSGIRTKNLRDML